MEWSDPTLKHGFDQPGVEHVSLFVSYFLCSFVLFFYGARHAWRARNKANAVHTFLGPTSSLKQGRSPCQTCLHGQIRRLGPRSASCVVLGV